MSNTKGEQTPEQIIATAEQDERDAAAAVEALEERVRSGDESVTPAKVEEARGLVKFLQLRREAAHRKAEVAKREARRQALVATVEEQLPKVKGREAEIRALVADATAKLRQAVKLAAENNDALRVLHVHAQHHAAEFSDVITSGGEGSSPTHVNVGDETYSAVDPGALLMRAVVPLRRAAQAAAPPWSESSAFLNDVSKYER